VTLPLKTPAAARALGTTYHKLIGLIRFDKLTPPPPRDSSGDYCWLPEDLDRAKQALQARRERKEAAHA